MFLLSYLFYSLYDLINIICELMLPKPQDCPPLQGQIPGHPFIPGHVTVDLFFPERRICFRNGAVFRTAVPKAAVNENGQPFTGKDNVRFSRYIVMQAVSKASGPEGFTKNDFW